MREMREMRGIEIGGGYMIEMREMKHFNFNKMEGVSI
jgi:hypothetical protein